MQVTIFDKYNKREGNFIFQIFDSSFPELYNLKLALNENYIIILALI